MTDTPDVGIGVYLSPEPSSGTMMVVDTDSIPEQDPPPLRAMVGLTVIPDTLEARVIASVAERVGSRPAGLEATVTELDDGRTKVTVSGEAVTDFLIPV